MKTTPTWLQETSPTTKFSKLHENKTVDVAIIGGGITGVLTAYKLSKTGKKVLLIEKDDFTKGATAYTTAFLTYEIDTDISDLQKSIGKEKAKRVWDSHKEAINEIEKIITKENISCDFMRCSEYILAADDKELQALEQEMETAKEIGYTHVLHKENLFPFPSTGSLEIKHQAKFHPLKYMYALLDLAYKHGVEIVCDTEVTKLSKGTPNVLETTSGTVTAEYVVISTYDPFNHPMKLFAHKGMYTSYVFEVEIEKDSFPEGLFLDQANPYHYFRIDKGEKKDRMIIGGEDHRHEIPMDHNKNYAALESYLETLIPSKNYTIVTKWDGPILEPSDGLAYIGHLYEKEHVSVAMGFSGNGMTYSMIAANMFTDFIVKKKNNYEDLYNPTRIPTVLQLVQKGRDYSEEFFGGAVKNMFSK